MPVKVHGEIEAGILSAKARFEATREELFAKHGNVWALVPFKDDREVTVHATSRLAHQAARAQGLKGDEYFVGELYAASDGPDLASLILPVHG